MFFFRLFGFPESPMDHDMLTSSFNQPETYQVLSQSHQCIRSSLTEISLQIQSRKDYHKILPALHILIEDHLSVSLGYNQFVFGCNDKRSL